MKRCPKCGFETADEEMNFCPHCSYEDGNGPVELITESTKASSSVNTVKSANPGKGDEIHSKEDVARVKSSIKTPADSADISGDANAVNIHGDVIKTNDDHATYNISNTTKELTEAEKLRNNETSYFNECVRLIHDGFIDDDGQRQLNAMQISLGLNKDRADSIQKNVTAQSIRKRTGLNITVVNLISSANRSIELNDKTRLLTVLKELEAYRVQYDDDNLDQIYYQLKAILSPDTYVKEFVTITPSYWETFWSYIPLIRIDIKKASESLAALERWGHFYPSQNQIVLQTVGLLMQNRLLEARETFKFVVPGYSEDLEPICFSIRELLDKHWDETTDVSPRAMFYVNSLFKATYDGIHKEAQERNAARIAEIHKAELEAKEIKNKKESFILAYSDFDGSVEKACQKAGITNATLNLWLSQDKAFIDIFDDAKKQLEYKREEARRSIEEQKAIAEKNNRLKNEFAQLLESNDCDLLKTCTEIGIDSATFRDWQNSDQIFADKIKYILRVHNEHLKSIQCKQRTAKFKKAIPVIAILLLLGLIVVCISNHRIVARYDSRIEDFNQALENANNSNIDALRVASEIFVDIKAIEREIFVIKKEESSKLREAFYAKADAIQKELNVLITKAETLEITDPEGARILSEEKESYYLVDKYKNTVAQ